MMCCKPPKQLKATASPITWCPHTTASTNMVCSSNDKSTVPRSRKSAFAVSESVWEVAIVCVADFDPDEEAEEIRDAVRQYAIEKGCELKNQKSVFIAEVSQRVRQDSLYRDDSADDSDIDPQEEAEEIRDAVRQYAIEKGCQLKIQKSMFIAEVSQRVRQDSLYRADDSADDSEDDSDPRSAGWMDVEQQV